MHSCLQQSCAFLLLCNLVYNNRLAHVSFLALQFKLMTMGIEKSDTHIIFEIEEVMA